MAKKTKKEDYAVVIKEEAKVVDNPVDDSPLVCILSKGQKVKILSRPKKYYGVGISHSVVGFIKREDVTTE